MRSMIDLSVVQLVTSPTRSSAMVMLPPKGKPRKIAQDVMKQKGVKMPKASGIEKVKYTGPYMQH